MAIVPVLPTKRFKQDKVTFLCISEACLLAVGPRNKRIPYYIMKADSVLRKEIRKVRDCIPRKTFREAIVYFTSRKLESTWCLTLTLQFPTFRKCGYWLQNHASRQLIKTSDYKRRIWRFADTKQITLPFHVHAAISRFTDAKRSGDS